MFHEGSLCTAASPPLLLRLFLRTRGLLYTDFTKTKHHVQNLMGGNICFRILPIRGVNFFVFFFRLWRCPGRISPPITGIKVMISGIAFDRFDRLSRLRSLPYDRFKIYTIVSIVRIELNSIQAIEVVSIVQVICDRPGSVSRWSYQSFEYCLRRRLERSGI